jgi:hypothetical protein
VLCVSSTLGTSCCCCCVVCRVRPRSL